MVVGRDDERAVRVLGVRLCDGGVPLLLVGHFVHAPLVLEAAYRLVHLTACELFDHLLQGRIVLSDNRVEMNGLHAGILELLEGPPGLDGLMLAGIADQEHPILRAETVQEVVHLSGARETRLVDHVQMLLSVVRGLASCEMSLQRAGGNPGLSEFLGRA